MRLNAVLIILGFVLMLGPWIYALASLAIDPETGQDAGVVAGAFMLTLPTFPLGATMALIGVNRRRKGK